MSHINRQLQDRELGKNPCKPLKIDARKNQVAKFYEESHTCPLEHVLVELEGHQTDDLWLHGRIIQFSSGRNGAKYTVGYRTSTKIFKIGDAVQFLSTCIGNFVVKYGDLYSVPISFLNSI